MEYYSDRRDYAFGIINTELFLVDANSILLDLLGSCVYFMIFSVVAESDKKKMEEILEKAKDGIDVCDIIYFAPRNDNEDEKNRVYKPYLTEISYNHNMAVYFLVVKDILKFEKDLIYKQQKNALYMNLLEIEQNVLFEYKKDTNIFRIFWIIDNKEHNIVMEDIDKWKERMLTQDFVSDNSIKVFECLCQKISDCKEDLKMMLDTKIISEGKIFDSNIVQGKVVIQKDNSKVMVGNWNIYNPIVQSVIKNYAADTYTDSLTGLLNKRAITMYAKEMIEKCDVKNGESVTLGILDVDCFKEVNDNFGHMFGDNILKSVANYIYDGVYMKGMAGRIGGDEFMIILENCVDDAELRNILRAIKFNIAALYEMKMNKTKQGCSIGVAKFPLDAKNYNDLFNTADKALYIAKSKGRNRYIIYDPEKHGEISSKSVVDSPILLQQDAPIEMSKLIGKIFVDESRDSLNEFMDFIIKNFEIDRISIFDKCDKNNPIYERKMQEYPTGNINMIDKLQENRIDNYLFVDNTGYYEYNNIDVYEEFRKIRTLSTYVFFTKNGRMIVFDRCLKQRSWSKLEIKIFTIANNVMKWIYDSL